jgi:hypothetical protein
MKRIVRRRPTPAMVVALVALVMATGGSSYAADGVDALASALANNSVGSKQIKNGQVKHADIGKNAVQADNVPANGLDGADIAESRLGKVPSSANADNAANAANASNADKVDGKDAADFVPRGEVRSFFVTLAGGQSSVIAQEGPLTWRAVCKENDAGADRIEIEVESSVPGAFVEQNSSTPMTAGTPQAVLTNSVATGSTNYGNDIDESSATAPDGTYTGIDGETVALGLNVFGHRCYTAGHITVLKGTL